MNPSVHSAFARRNHGAAGMTLLEVVLAVTTLAAMSTLIAGLWSQTRDWTLENASHQTALRRERALNMMREQWESRVLAVTLGGRGAPAVALTERELAFTTLTPILFREHPMARVVYRLIEENAAVVGAHAVWKLEYEESPVRNPASAISSAAGGDESRTIILLEGLDELRFERWLDESDAPRSGIAPPRAGWYRVDEAVGVPARATQDTGSAASSSSSASSSAAPPSSSTEVDTEDELPALRAGRLVGIIKGEPFAWQFLAAPSR